MAKFLDLFEDVTKKGRKIPTNEYLKSGNHLIVDQGQALVAGYSNEEDGLFTDVPAIVFGDHTRVIKYIDEPCFLGADGVKLLKAKGSSANYKYLYYALCNAKIPNTGYNRHFKWLKEVSIPLYDSIKQTQIAATLDKLQSVIAKRKQQLEKLDQLVKARFVEMFGDPVENPLQWDTMPLDNACQSIVDCPHSTPSYTFEDTGYMCIRTSIIKKNQILWDKIEYISKDEYEQRIKRRKPQKGDIIYTREGAILGIAAVVDRECNVALGQRSMLLSPNKDICSPEFISNAMNFDSFFNRVTEGVSGSASPHINVADIRAFSIMMPPLDLQEQFAAFVEQIDKSKFDD